MNLTELNVTNLICGQKAEVIGRVSDHITFGAGAVGHLGVSQSGGKGGI